MRQPLVLVQSGAQAETERLEFPPAPSPDSQLPALDTGSAVTATRSTRGRALLNNSGEENRVRRRRRRARRRERNGMPK